MKVLRTASLGSNSTGSYKKSITQSDVHFSYSSLGSFLSEMKHNHFDVAHAECK